MHHNNLGYIISMCGFNLMQAGLPSNALCSEAMLPKSASTTVAPARMSSAEMVYDNYRENTHILTFGTKTHRFSCKRANCESPIAQKMVYHASTLDACVPKIVSYALPTTIFRGLLTRCTTNCYDGFVSRRRCSKRCWSVHGKLDNLWEWNNKALVSSYDLALSRSPRWSRVVNLGSLSIQGNCNKHIPGRFKYASLPLIVISYALSRKHIMIWSTFEVLAKTRWKRGPGQKGISHIDQIKH
jgi:hypothetical protein